MGLHRHFNSFKWGLEFWILLLKDDIILRPISLTAAVFNMFPAPPDVNRSGNIIDQSHAFLLSSSFGINNSSLFVFLFSGLLPGEGYLGQ